MNGHSKKMRLVGRQSQILSHINELAVSLRRPARDVVVPFFKRISEPVTIMRLSKLCTNFYTCFSPCFSQPPNHQFKEHKASFLGAVETFIERIQKRAVDKRKEMDEEQARKRELGLAEGEEVLSPEERLGPGGLDPIEVFQTLPPELQDAFQTQDTQKLKAALAGMPANVAKDYMKRCEDSGLWVPEK